MTCAAASTVSQSSIGKGWVIKGEITGTEPLFIDCCVEGTIDLPGGLVTLGRNGQVSATISAGDIVVLGSVSGDITATNRLEVRAAGVVTGNVTASRLSIEEGAYLQSSVNIARDESKKTATTGSTADAKAGKTHLVGPQKVEKLPTELLPMTA
jgi:cytoskeletal protein CcmA (bactofilin family)